MKLTDQEKVEFDFITTQLERLTVAASSPKTAAIAGACLLHLQSHVAEVFPAMISTYVALVKSLPKKYSQMAILGPQMWSTLHKRSMLPVHMPSEELNWLNANWAAQIKCGECKDFFVQFMRTNPPNFESYFAWTVKFHNAVNAKLGKPQFTMEQAIDSMAKK